MASGADPSVQATNRIALKKWRGLGAIFVSDWQ
jgi:hypothetical protein